MELIKIYIQAHDLGLFTEGKKPSKYWTTNPSYLQNIVEVTIPVSKLKEWLDGNKKSILFD